MNTYPMFPKKKDKNKVVPMPVEEYLEMVKKNPLMIPKRSKLLPPKSKTMKAVCPESELQKAANQLIELYKWDYIRFDDWFMTWMRMNAPPHVQKHFFSQIGGKMPDNFVRVTLGKGFFLGCAIELKTEDKKGRAVGQLHGKQKRYALAEEWQIARNTKQIETILELIKEKVTLVKTIFHKEKVL
jgi:hypothetical protein